jgi:DNA mismatch repair ATPase MutL
MQLEVKLFQQKKLIQADRIHDPIAHRVVIEILTGLCETRIFEWINEACEEICNKYWITAEYLKETFESDWLESIKQFSIEFKVTTFIEFLGTTLIKESLDVLSIAVQNCFRKEDNQIHISGCIIETLASKAWRHAIKFNDHLCRWDMKTLLKYMSMWKDPFHCAHGRPSIYPICSLKSYK